MSKSAVELGHSGIPLRIKDTNPIETPHDEIAKEAFDQIVSELDKNGNTPYLQALRERFFKIFATYWQHILLSYMEEHTKLGIPDDDLNGQEIKIGDDIVSLNGIEAGYLEDAIRLDLKRRNSTEDDELSFFVHQTGEVDELFMPSLSVKLHPDITSSTTTYTFEFLNGRIASMQRTKYHDDPNQMSHTVLDRRSIDFGKI